MRYVLIHCVHYITLRYVTLEKQSKVHEEYYCL